MAVTFTLFSDAVATIDLTDTSSSIFLQEDQYLPVVATPTGDGKIPPYVIETLPVGLHATSYNGYATLLQTLAELQRQAAQFWMNRQQCGPVLLTCKLDGETTARQALVKAIHFEFRDAGWQEWLYQECASGTCPTHLWGTILVERHPYWERTAARTFPNTTPTAAAAVKYDYTSVADVVGDVEARINSLAIRAATGSITMTHFWLGIRSDNLYMSDPANFIAVWEVEDGDIADADAAVDATEPNTASPGSGSGEFVLCDPARAGGSATNWDDGSFHGVVVVRPTDVGYNSNTIQEAFGRFLWLLRCKVSSGEWEVRLSLTGYAYALNAAPGDPVSVSATDWCYREMGIFSIPVNNPQALQWSAYSYSALGPQLHDNRVVIEARRTSGTGTLSVDCLCPVPVDEGFLKLVGQAAGGAAATNYDIFWGQGLKEDMDAAVMLDSTPDIYSTSCAFEAENFRLPPGDGRIICVYSRTADQDVFTDQIEFADSTCGNSLYVERWTGLRGSE